MKRTIVAAVTIAIAFGAVACSEDYKGLGDAPVGTRYEAPRAVIINPDGFPNLATGCDGHGHRYYVTTRDNTPPVIIDDKSCDGVPAGKPSR